MEELPSVASEGVVGVSSLTRTTPVRPPGSEEPRGGHVARRRGAGRKPVGCIGTRPVRRGPVPTPASGAVSRERVGHREGHGSGARVRTGAAPARSPEGGRRHQVGHKRRAARTSSGRTDGYVPDQGEDIAQGRRVSRQPPAAWRASADHRAARVGVMPDFVRRWTSTTSAARRPRPPPRPLDGQAGQLSPHARLQAVGESGVRTSTTSSTSCRAAGPRERLAHLGVEHRDSRDLDVLGLARRAGGCGVRVQMRVRVEAWL
jgi:hypothetical protein